jgi:hypothetical protein
MIDFTTEQWQMVIMLLVVVGICYMILYKFDIDE